MLKAIEILPKDLKSYNQLPDDLVSLLCARVLAEQKILDFFSFTVIFDLLLVDMAEMCRVLHARAYGAQFSVWILCIYLYWRDRARRHYAVRWIICLNSKVPVSSVGSNGCVSLAISYVALVISLRTGSLAFQAWRKCLWSCRASLSVWCNHTFVCSWVISLCWQLGELRKKIVLTVV